MIAHGGARRYAALETNRVPYLFITQAGLGIMLLACVFAAFVVAPPDPAHVSIDVWAGRSGASRDVGWLGSYTAAFLQHGGGTLALVVGTALWTLVGTVLVAWRAARRSDIAGALVALACLALCALDAFHAGSGITSLTFAAALLLALEWGTPLGALLAACLAVVWCNASAQGLFAPLLAGSYALGVTLRDGTRAPATRFAWLAALGCCVALLATPAAFAFPHAALEALRLDRALAQFVPVHPADIAPFAYRIGFPAIVAGGFALGGALGVADIPLLACGLGLALCNGSYLPLLGVVAGPAFALALRGRVPVVAAGLCATAACAVIAFSLPARAQSDGQPFELIARLKAGTAQHRLFCARIDWCSYATAQGDPRIGVFVDGRVERYGPAVLQAEATIARARPHWQAVLRSNRIDALLVGRRDALGSLLLLDGHWRVVAADERAVLFERTPR